MTREDIIQWGTLVIKSMSKSYERRIIRQTIFR